ncbi:peptidase domain-containing ABC transporter [Chryseobacterium sp.]
MQEIKLNNLEEYKRQEWSLIQSNIYLNNIEKLKVNQKYESYKFINFFQNILVVFTSSLAVMNGQMTVGTMLSIVYIIGGMNNPISQLITFFLRYHLVKISFERLNEIHNKEDEENISQIGYLERIFDISLKNVSFSYDNSHFILNDIDLIIPKGKTTAIVGASGSGKTSLLKLILKFYTPQMGKISLEEISLKEIENVVWREKCGVILQDSHIFSDTVAYNIALEKNPDQSKLNTAVALSNISDFIDMLPLKIDTIIGSEGVGLSQGQKQRILIARAIYKNPDYLFFDEATNSLDAKNERIIVQNIDNFFKHKTMIVVAHRLSTVKNADQIIVLDSGRIVEQGNHDQLIQIRGKYFELIQNQLELGL